VISSDVSQVRALAGEFTRAPAVMQRMAIGAADRRGKAMRDDARERVRGHRSLPHYPESITYEVSRTGAGTIEVALGIDKGAAQGPLWNLIEFGSVNNAPIPHLIPAAEAAGPGFTTDIGVIAERAVGG